MLLVALLLVPIATAVASFFARRRAAMEAANLAGFGVVFLIAVALAAQVLAAGTVSLANGFFYADALSALVILLTASVALVCATYSIGYLRDDQQSGELGDDCKRHGADRAASHVLHADAAVRLLHAVHGGGQQPGSDVGGDGGHHAGFGLPGHLLWQGHLAGGRVEVRHHRRRGPVDGAVRHAGGLLCGAQPDRFRGAQRVELVGAGAARRATGQDLDAAGLRPDSDGLWNQGGPRADAHLEAGRIQRGTGAHRRDSVLGACSTAPSTASSASTF